MQDLKRISIITGHYGSGKTNIAVNMALQAKKDGKKVMIVDLDIVNPYFRTSDFSELFLKHDIRLIAPTYANSNLDTPILSAEINAAFDDKDSFVIIDVGGDDAGAIALGRYNSSILQEDYDLFYVVNQYRFQTKDVSDTTELLEDIERCSRLKATKLINNSNLGKETTCQLVENSLPYIKSISEQTGLPNMYTCINKDIDFGENDFLPVSIYVKTMW